MTAAILSIGDRQKIRAEARAFRIWSAGRSVDWDCTARDLADATGIRIDTVRRICAARGWGIQPCESDGSHLERPELVSMMGRYVRDEATLVEGE